MTRRNHGQTAKHRTSSITEIAAFAGVTRNTIYSWKRLEGYPVDPKTGEVCLWDLAIWRASLDYQFEADVSGSDPKSSPALEEYRRQRAAQEAIKTEVMRKSFIKRESIHSILGRIAGVIRTVGERVRKDHGEEIYASTYGAMLDSFRLTVETALGELEAEESHGDDEPSDLELEMAD